MRLQCVSPHHDPWLLCVWQTPENAKICVVNNDDQFSQVCNDSTVTRRDRRYVVVVQSHSCDLSFMAGVHDHGVWSCMLTSAGVSTMTSVTYTDLGVILTPTLEISVSSTSISSDSNNIITLVDGEDYRFTCVGHREYPRSQLHWTLTTDCWSHIVNHHQDAFTVSSTNYFYQSRSSASVSADVSINNSVLTCISLQIHPHTNRVISETNKSLTLFVIGRDESPPSGSAFGIIIMIFFLLSLTSKNVS